MRECWGFLAQSERRRQVESALCCRVCHEARPGLQGHAVSRHAPRSPAESEAGSRPTLARLHDPKLVTHDIYLGSFHGKIQDKDDDYYMQFNLVICGLDSVDARRWMSATLVNLVDPEVPESLKPLIDGGTEGACFSRPRFG